jgi:hypothetical protein
MMFWFDDDRISGAGFAPVSSQRRKQSATWRRQISASDLHATSARSPKPTKIKRIAKAYA